MNDDPLIDPQLRSLEARLASTTIPLTSIQQQELLYRCAFAAGEKSARGRLMRWQTVAAACAVLFLATGVLLLSDRWAHRPESAQSPDRTPGRPWQRFALDEIPFVEHLPTALELDAWQVPEHPKDLASSDEIDPRLSSLTVGALTLKVFER